jgi:hypothetical protein
MNEIDDFANWKSVDDLKKEFFTKHPEQIIEYKKGLIQDYNEKEINLNNLYVMFKNIMNLELFIKGIKEQAPFSEIDILKEIDKIAQLQFPKPQISIQEETVATVDAVA